MNCNVADLQEVLEAAAVSADASRQVAAAVPSYAELSAPPLPELQPAWLSDVVLAQQLQFLFNVLAPCASQLDKVCCARPSVRVLCACTLGAHTRYPV